MRIAICAVALSLLLAGCGIKTVSFPADLFLTNYTQLRLQVQDDTYAARKRCSVDPVPDKIKKDCQELESRMTAWNLRDAAVLKAILNGGTVDKETMDAAFGYVAPILQLAAGIAAKGALIP